MELTIKIKKVLEKYDLEPEDIAFCDLVHAGWSKHEAAFYSYHLAYFDLSKINLWLRERQKMHPGIFKLMADHEEEDKEARKKQRELEEKVKKLTARKKATTDTGSSDDRMTKEELGKMYVQIMRDPQSDDKTKMDASKAYSALYQMQKEQEKDEDNRINFFLPVNCHYCDRCKNCELKVELEKMNFEIRAKKTIPYLWEIVKKPNNE